MKTHAFFNIAILLSISILTGCDDSEQPTPAQGAGDFALVTASLNPDGFHRAYYLQRASIDSPGLVNNDFATQIDPNTGAMIHAFNGDIYFSDHTNSSMEKWTFNSSGRAVKEAEMNISELVYQGNAVFKDANTAFVGGISTSIVIFDPSTMRKTGAIDFNAHSIIGESTDFPEPGGSIVAEGVTELTVRDNILYAAILPMSNTTGFIAGKTGCTIVVIDLDAVDINSTDNGDAVVKRIYDDRGSWTGGWASGGGSSFMRIDEQGDIYLLCHNAWASGRALFNKPASILRIKKGETDFDPNYYFDLETAARGNGSPVLNMEYYGGGKFLAAVQNPEALDPENSYSYYFDPVYQWWSFDLYNKTAQIVNKDYTRGGVASVSLFKDGYGYVPFENHEAEYVMKVDLSNFECSKLFDTHGVPHLFSLD